MKHDPVLHSFLQAQMEEGLALASSTDLLQFTVIPGLLPNRFLVEFSCDGLAKNSQGRIVTVSRWRIGIWFPPDYLRRKVHVSQVLTYLGPEPEPFHPNMRGPFICLELSLGMGMVEILHGLFDLLTYQLYATADPLNADCAQWARQQPEGRFPVDSRPLKWRRPQEPLPA